MMTSEEIEQEETGATQDKIDQAFISSGEKKLGDIALQPYTPDRVVAAQNMGLHYGRLDKVSVDAFRENNIYPGAMRDVIIIMWLCGGATKQDIYEAGLMAQPAYDKAVRWATEIGLVSAESDLFVEAYQQYFRIMDEVSASRVKLEKKTTDSVGT